MHLRAECDTHMVDAIDDARRIVRQRRRYRGWSTIAEAATGSRQLREEMGVLAR